MGFPYVCVRMNGLVIRHDPHGATFVVQTLMHLLFSAALAFMECVYAYFLLKFIKLRRQRANQQCFIGARLGDTPQIYQEMVTAAS